MPSYWAVFQNYRQDKSRRYKWTDRHNSNIPPNSYMYTCWCLTSNNSQYIQISNHWDLNLLWIILQLSTLASDKDTVCIGFTWQGHLWPSAGQPRDSSWPILWLFPLNDHQWSQVEGVWPRKHDGNKSKTSVSHPLHSPQYMSRLTD